ncbi:pyridoxal phosphate enzyme, YggS-like family protein [Bacteriovorax sp. BSW11_IV]|nr:pyridoxal phosphate enzyme, YggS-like family protein [Bacteriovorax sp. BSW11_IV]
MVHSIDRFKVAKMINDKLLSEDRTLDILIQVNTSNEDSKYGCHPLEAKKLVKEISALSQLRIKGLMTIGKLGGTIEETQDCFKTLQDIAKDIKLENIPNVSMDELSMGMTSDYKMAIEYGSTIVRVGQAIFGKRNLPDSHYWPEEKN